jgi:hypothetical protein
MNQLPSGDEDEAQQHNVNIISAFGIRGKFSFLSSSSSDLSQFVMTLLMNRDEEEGGGKVMEAGTCMHFTLSISLSAVDECDRLWIVDCGLTDLLGATKKFRNPSVLVFDLNNNGALIRRFEIPENQIKADSFFVNVVSDFGLKRWRG